jgi:hypothetical protein
VRAEIAPANAGYTRTNDAASEQDSGRATRRRRMLYTRAFHNGYDDKLMSTQFGLVMPAGATILGVDVLVERSANDSLARP